jgi:alkylation response protein AidB-like acyl-CoA dehydrogenase
LCSTNFGALPNDRVTPMDFTFTEEQETISKLARELFERRATPEQQRRYLPGVIDGTRILSAGLQEPGRSDPVNPATTARRDGPNWRLDGAKELVPAAQLADTVLIPASIDDGTDGAVGLFLLATDADGARVAATTQHVHGGIGIDITYPLHRYFLWAKQNELTLGSASQQLAHLGSTYPEGRL